MRLCKENEVRYELLLEENGFGLRAYLVKPRIREV